MEQTVNAGYIIKEKIQSMSETYVLGHDPKAPAAYVTWANPKPDYYVFGHYFNTEADARRDLFKRAIEHMPEQEQNDLADFILTEEHKAAIISEARTADHLADIESCLYDAVDALDLEVETVAALMADPRFKDLALNTFYHQDHSYENEALAESLETLIKERFPELLTKNQEPSREGEGTPSLDDVIHAAQSRSVIPGEKDKGNRNQLDR